MKSAIFWYIALENPSINVEPGRNGVTCGGFVKVHPNGCFCSEGSHFLIMGKGGVRLYWMAFVVFQVVDPPENAHLWVIFYKRVGETYIIEQMPPRKVQL